MLIALVAVVAAVALAVLGNGGTLPEAEPDRLHDPLPADRPVRPAAVSAADRRRAADRAGPARPAPRPVGTAR